MDYIAPENKGVQIVSLWTGSCNLREDIASTSPVQACKTKVHTRSLGSDDCLKESESQTMQQNKARRQNAQSEDRRPCKDSNNQGWNKLDKLGKSLWTEHAYPAPNSLRTILRLKVPKPWSVSVVQCNICDTWQLQSGSHLLPWKHKNNAWFTLLPLVGCPLSNKQQAASWCS